MLKKIIKSRLDIVKYLMILIFLILIFRLADLQIVKGEEYKKISDVLRMKTIGVSAPRGNIVDKYGRLIAGNKQSYSVNIMKTEVSDKTINDTALAVVNIIIQNGDTYKNEIPILINPIRFKYEDDEQNWKYKYNIPYDDTAREAFAKLRSDYNIFEDISDEEAYEMLKRSYGVELPFSVESFQFTYDRDEIKWKKSLGFIETATAEEIFYKLLEKYKISKDTYDDEKAQKILAVKYLLGQNRYKAYEPVEIAVNINEQTRAQIEENKIYFPGVEILEKPLRQYPNGQLASHIVGYMSKIGSELEELAEKGYTPLDMIGRTGIEYSMEEYLKGTDGSKLIEVDVSGTLINTIDQVEPIPGNTVFLNIDNKLQRVAEDAMKTAIQTITTGDKSQNIDKFENARVGAVVAIDVNTGKILALVSEPGYDPNLFAAGISSKDWELLQPQEKGLYVPKPLFNNAIAATLPPGSTLKMVTAVAGLELGKVGIKEQIYDKGLYTEIPGVTPSCSIFKTLGIPHYWTDMVKAIQVSCNYYFFEVARRVGGEQLEAYTSKFGFGDYTGIELPGEVKGNIEGPGQLKKNQAAKIERYLINTLQIADKKVIDDVKSFVNLSFSTQTERSNYIKERLQYLGVTKSYASINSKLEQMAIDKNYNSIARAAKNLPTKDTNVDNVLSALKLSHLEGNEELREIVQQVIINTRIELNIINYVNATKWQPGAILNAAIGQGVNDVTPLQLANYVATIANGGTRYKPYLVDKVVAYDGTIVMEKQPEVVETIDISPENLEAIKKGMFSVVNVQGGTALRRFKDSKVIVSGKTGTAQAGGDYKAHAWFVAFAPYDKPEIAVAAVVFQGGHGDYAAPIARAIIEEYLASVDNKDKVITENEIFQ